MIVSSELILRSHTLFDMPSITAIFTGFLFAWDLITFPSNCLIIYIIIDKRLWRRPVNFLILNLTIIDVLSNLVLFTHAILTNLYYTHVPHVYFLLWSSISAMLGCISLCSMALLAFERYKAVTSKTPVRTNLEIVNRKKFISVTIQVCVIWIACTFLFLANLIPEENWGKKPASEPVNQTSVSDKESEDSLGPFHFHLQSDLIDSNEIIYGEESTIAPNTTNQQKPWKWTYCHLFKIATHWPAFQLVRLLLVDIIPFLVLLYSYVGIMVHLKNSAKESSRLGTGVTTRSKQRSSSTSRAIVTVLFSFVVCRTPLFASIFWCSVARAIDYEWFPHIQPDILYEIILYGSGLQSILNPSFLFWLSSEYREHAKELYVKSLEYLRSNSNESRTESTSVRV